MSHGYSIFFYKLTNSIASFLYPTHSSKHISLADVQRSEVRGNIECLRKTQKLSQGQAKTFSL